jgi:hypothetical protein
MRIEIKSDAVITEERKSRTGEGFTTYSQTAFLIGEDERKKFSLRVSDRSSGYKPGLYDLSADSFFVNGYQGLELARVVLVPVVK